MNVLYHKHFLKDLSKIPSLERKQIEDLVFKQILLVQSIHSFGKAEKLKGYKNYYKIRWGSYRIGFQYENNVLTFERVLHRRDIYRFFP